MSNNDFDNGQVELRPTFIITPELSGLRCEAYLAKADSAVVIARAEIRVPSVELLHYMGEALINMANRMKTDSLVSGEKAENMLRALTNGIPDKLIRN